MRKKLELTPEYARLKNEARIKNFMPLVLDEGTGLERGQNSACKYL